jgi:hypothetical protein
LSNACFLNFDSHRSLPLSIDFLSRSEIPSQQKQTLSLFMIAVTPKKKANRKPSSKNYTIWMKQTQRGGTAGVILEAPSAQKCAEVT